MDLAQFGYFSDLTLGATWIDVANAGISPVANGRDAVLVSIGMNLPIYLQRLDSPVRSAGAQVVATTRQYDSLRDDTLEQVTDLFAQARSHEDMLTLFREDILPKARQTLAVSNQVYNVGEVDFLQLIDNRRQLLRYEINDRRLEASLRQTLAELERVVGGFAGAAPESVPTLPACHACFVDCTYCLPPPLPYAYLDGCTCHSCAASRYLSRLPQPVDERVETISEVFTE